MDTPRIDTIARLIGGGLDRRQLSRGLAGALLGGLALPGSALAGCKKVGKKCDKNSECCKGARCRRGRCRCKGRFTTCNRKCYDTARDERHCGGCNQPCAAGESCFDGTSAPQPPSTCPSNASYCTNNPCLNNDNCRCGSTPDGLSVCVDEESLGGFCGECNSNADCVDRYGAGTYCMDTNGTNCCGPTQNNVCRRLCDA